MNGKNAKKASKNNCLCLDFDSKECIQYLVIFCPTVIEAPSPQKEPKSVILQLDRSACNGRVFVLHIALAS